MREIYTVWIDNGESSFDILTSNEEMENKFQNSEQETSHEICVIIENYNNMVDIFLKILPDRHYLSSWPPPNPGYFVDPITRPEFVGNYMNFYKKCIRIRPKMGCSKLIIAIVTNKFIRSEECNKLIKHSKRVLFYSSTYSKSL